MTIGIAEALGLSSVRIEDLRLFAKYHDIGIIAIKDEILFKSGPLNYEEMEQMRNHSVIGYRIAQAIPDLFAVADWILKHHERWDGQGYPLRLKGQEIPLECRILAIADAYDAMINDRPYRKAMSHQQAMAELHNASGEQFEPSLLELFEDHIGR